METRKETIQTVKIIEINLVCPNCQKCNVRHTGAIESLAAQYKDGVLSFKHHCPDCLSTFWFPKKYPFVDKEILSNAEGDVCPK